MLVVSKFKDYYDSVGNTHGIDKSVVYNRKEIILEEDEYKNEFTKTILKSLGNTAGFGLNCYDGEKAKKDWYIIGFCGKLYVCLRSDYGYAYNKHGKYTEIIYFSYSDNIIENLRNDKRNKDTINNINIIEKIDLYDLFYKYKTPCFAINNNNRVVFLNPRLKDYEFFKIKDSFTAFQEIQQFISGRIGVETKEPIVTDDKFKIIGAGFDLKTSFRKEKV